MKTNYFEEAKVTRSDEGTDVLLDKKTIAELGWEGQLSKGPLVFGRGPDRAVIRSIEHQGNAATSRGNEPQASTR